MDRLEEPEFRWENSFLQKDNGRLINPARLTTDFNQPICGLPNQGATFNLSGKDDLLPCLAERLLQWAVESIGR